MTSIMIEPIGEFKQHPEWTQSYETDHNIAVPFLDSDKICFHCEYFEDDETFLADASAILTEFLALTLQDRQTISKYVMQNCQEFMDMVGDEYFDKALLEVIKNNDIHAIWRHVEPLSVAIVRHDKTGQMFLLVECGCDWEEEHGLQLTIKEGMILTGVTEMTCYHEETGLMVYLKTR